MPPEFTACPPRPPRNSQPRRPRARKCFSHPLLRAPRRSGATNGTNVLPRFGLNSAGGSLDSARVSRFTNPSRRGRHVHQAQALVEFAIVMPVMLLMTLGLIDLGRAFVFGVAVQEGTRQAARVAASANYSNAVAITNSDVLGRLVAGSNPALAGCLPQTTSQSCNGGT